MPPERHIHEKFHYPDRESLMKDAEALGLALPWSEDLAPLAAPLALDGARVAPNRLVALPMEGFDSDAEGTPTERSFRRYRRYAEGGAGLVWVEACAVAPEARTNPGQFRIHAGNVARYKQLVDAVRAAGVAAFGRAPVVVLQLTHSGRFSKPAGTPAPLPADHNPALDARFRVPADLPVVDDATLDALPARFADAARLAQDAGFDGVDVKVCHGYLFGELLAARARPGRYGGAFERRIAAPLEALRRVREAAPDLLLATRLGIYDPHPWPWGFGCAREDPTLFDFNEPFALIAKMRDAGARLFGLTIGNPYFHPHYNRPYDGVLPGGSPPAEHPLVGVARALAAARAAQEAFPGLAMVGFGMAWLRRWFGPVAAGALATGGMALAGQGRGSFAYPDAARTLLEGGAMDAKKVCVTCSRCTQFMREGVPTGCPVRDPAAFSPAGGPS